MILKKHDLAVETAFFDNIDPLLEIHGCQEVLNALNVRWKRSSLVKTECAHFAFT